jgi:hypothetical protein
MTTSLVFLEKGSIFIQFGRIVEQGKISIRTDENSLVVNHSFNTSNFETIPINGLKGKYQITIDLGNELIRKSITI